MKAVDPRQKGQRSGPHWWKWVRPYLHFYYTRSPRLLQEENCEKICEQFNPALLYKAKTGTTERLALQINVFSISKDIYNTIHI